MRNSQSEHARVYQPAKENKPMLELTRHRRFIEGQWNILDVLVRESRKAAARENGTHLH